MAAPVLQCGRQQQCLTPQRHFASAFCCAEREGVAAAGAKRRRRSTLLADADLTPGWRQHGSPAVAGRLSVPGRRASGMKQVSCALHCSHCVPEMARHPALLSLAHCHTAIRVAGACTMLAACMVKLGFATGIEGGQRWVSASVASGLHARLCEPLDAQLS